MKVTRKFHTEREYSEGRLQMIAAGWKVCDVTLSYEVYTVIFRNNNTDYDPPVLERFASGIQRCNTTTKNTA